MKILVTGSAGFIGSSVAEKLLSEGYQVVGVDNFDSFYSKERKEKNIEGLLSNASFAFKEVELSDKNQVDDLFSDSFDVVVHLAAKAGVRPSISDPLSYIQSNVEATNHILEAMKASGVMKLVFASSSSIYGNNKKIPFSESDDVNEQISPYAFTKKSCELMNYSYHHLYDFDILNLRFFTVFGPKQRPDLAIHKFVKKILNDEAIEMFGDGSTARDYTFIDDIVDGILKSIDYTMNNKCYEIINIGNNQPVKLHEMIDMLYELTGKDKNVKQLPMQPGDVDVTYADISKAQSLLGYQPKTDFKEGLQKFIDWYKAAH